MKRNLRTITLAALVVVLVVSASSTAMAQSEERTHAEMANVSDPYSPESATCPPGQTFTYSSGVPKFRICITTHGNLFKLESPAGYEHLTPGTDQYGDGYVLCSVQGVHGYDTGAQESGWGAATATQPGGAGTLPLTITRNTTDGRFQLRQTFEWNPLEKEVTITMVLRNLSAGSISNVKLARYFDADIDNTDNGENYDIDSDSVWIREIGSSGVRHALGLTALSFAIPHTASAEGGDDWHPSFGMNAKTCNIYSTTAPGVGNYVGRLTYTLGTIPAGGTKTVKLLYRRF